MIRDSEKDVVNWKEVKLDKSLAKLLPVDSIKKYKFIPFEETADSIKVAVVDRTDVNTQNALRFFVQKNKKRIDIFPISESEFNLLLGKLKHSSAEINKFLSAFEESSQIDENEKAELAKKKGGGVGGILKDAPVAKMVEVIIKNAIDGRASDIHIEPMDDYVRVRYRVDGILYNSISLPQKIGPAIVSRIKILSNLKIDEKRKPQDGRFRIKDLGQTIDFRVSTFPVSYGEKVVMRILDTRSGIIGLDKLGVEGRDDKLIRKIIEEPHGIILVTGPTGSGKSTTLYSILNILNREGINIVTLEDPVEYVLEGVNQSQVKPQIEYTFSSGLRSILRQDPDVIMVGEIRDEETAELAIHAALTGHLVLSTLHTNSAIGAIARLVDMGIQPFLLASSLNLLIGQRLVRRICPKCKKEVENLSVGAKKMIERELQDMPKQGLERVGAKTAKDVKEIKAFEGEGCSECQNKGVKGRVGIYEMVEVTEEVSSLIGSGSPETIIEKAAKKDGYTTMKQDGIIKVLEGYTTIEEVQRVTDEDANSEELENQTTGEETVIEDADKEISGDDKKEVNL
ncbi:type II/IV secretion system protein [bacterium]|jgi:type IV pilus assembly protein PilB|nr:type II/IV secretion system protein [bacterium]MBT4250736.1 type II/IV secretion system protein [bacterium]MBT4598181.1 type II/IV secretion system protein [bacterium]MBT6753779.1 type II/IV secretion system protein [bacterium]MBT7037508.1 type II/IV secretion system protein [bacterium]